MQKNLVKLSYLAQKVLQRGQVLVLQLVDMPSMLTQNNGRKMPIFVTPCILPTHTGFKNIFIPNWVLINCSKIPQNLSAQAQKFGISIKKASLGVRSPCCWPYNYSGKREVNWCNVGLKRFSWMELISGLISLLASFVLLPMCARLIKMNNQI